MNNEQLQQELKALIVETLGLEDIKPEDIQTDEALFVDGLGLDSIDAVDLLVKLRPFVGEKSISPNDFKQVRTIDDLVKVLAKIIND